MSCRFFNTYYTASKQTYQSSDYSDVKLSSIVTVEVLDHDLREEHGVLDHFQVLSHLLGEEEQVGKQHRVDLRVRDVVLRRGLSCIVSET